ncbi:BRCT domain [Arabidopsis thaliana x Arabidopsis arenosa]|uniref:BRCT domain n=1 Tax=Arabidopsis thaliana x Arabidopsis arenosa TaxID=1240361 RepID=A0A8T2BKH4_9BRAS|nr:BRCT domain [Arabidopsis thaliana x Arabidopsis arenosa]
MKTTQLFKGANVFMSRNLVPPEVFDTLLDAFKLNGAEIFLCCDPSRSGPSDFHVIASPDHEKFEDLKAKGCNLIGPQCALSCAKEGRPLPQGGFTCCLAMDGLKVLASGFLIDEKAKIRELVTSMGGVLLSKASSDVNFVIVKNVLAAKYKWALNKKPIVTLNWLHRCWNEHRVVPQEPYKIPPFSGLTICVTRIPADERKGMEKVISEYGGNYSAELTKSCTHLIADAAEGDKYKVARKWGHIQIVTRKWFQQSIDRKVCLNEELYPVLSSIPLTRGVQDLGVHNGQEKFPSVATASAADSYVSCAQSRDSDIEASGSQNVFSTSMNPSTDVKEPSGGPTTRPQEQNIDGCTARDSESEDNDLYLSDCRIFLLGFEASEMRKLAKLVRRGGGSRYMLLNERMTHIVVGTPSESEKREARSVAASGVIQVVIPSWLEDCDREKKEIPVHKIYTANHLILPRDSACLTKGSFVGMSSMEQSKHTSGQTMAYDSSSRSINVSNGTATLLGKNKEAMQEFGRKDEIHTGRKIVSPKQKETLISLVTSKSEEQQSTQCEFSGQNEQERKSSVFKGETFCFSHSFPEDRRPDIVEWVNQGGGEVVNDPLINNARFTIECHGGFRSAGTTQTIYVSSHWVRYCLEVGCLLAVSSHILYSPLPCQTPLPGFESLCICSSQHKEKDIPLLKNLCVVLGAKYVKKLTRKVTHLLCISADGHKYETASKWGIVSVTPDWLCECVRQNQVVCPDNFHPKESTTQEAGSGFASHFHTQFVPMASRDNVSLLVSHSEDREKNQSFAGKSGCGKGEFNNRLGEIGKEQAFPSKKAKLLRDGQESDVYPVRELPSNCDRPSHSGEGIVSGYDVGSGREVPDVADTIEDLLEQTSKIQDQKSPGMISEKTVSLKFVCSFNLYFFLSNQYLALFDSLMIKQHFSTSEQYNTGNHCVTGLSRHWINRVQKNDDMGSPPGDVTTGTYGNFSETQTESQVVGYEEDLSGRQMLIDRVRTRSSLT